jgi:transposase-like protein
LVTKSPNASDDGRAAILDTVRLDGASPTNAVVQALLDNLLARGLDPALPRLFIMDGSNALSRAIRRSFGREALVQRCQIRKARNIMELLPKPIHAATRRVLRQAWEVDNAEKAEKLIRNLAQRLEHDAPGVSARVLEASMKSSPSRGSACRKNFVARSPAPTSWRMYRAPCVASAAM